MFKVYNRLNDVDINALKYLYRQSIEAMQTESYNNCSISEQTLLAEQDFYFDIRTFFKNDGTFLAVWSERDTYVTAARIEPYMDGYLLAGLETDPAFRCMGYAKQLVMSLIALLQRIGCKCLYSHVNITNHASLAVHYACGFRKILDYAKFIDGTVSSKSITLCISFQ